MVLNTGNGCGMWTSCGMWNKCVNGILYIGFIQCFQALTWHSYWLWCQRTSLRTRTYTRPRPEFMDWKARSTDEDDPMARMYLQRSPPLLQFTVHGIVGVVLNSRRKLMHGQCLQNPIFTARSFHSIGKALDLLLVEHRKLPKGQN